MATGAAPGGQQSPASQASAPETEILHVVVAREGMKVSTKWGLHPSVKEALHPEEWKELTDIMGKVSNIVGHRFSQVLAQAEEGQTGTA